MNLDVALLSLTLLLLAQTSLSVICERSASPNAKNAIPTYDLDLDLPPQTRWYIPVYDKKHELQKLVFGVQDLLKDLLGDNLYNLLYSNIHVVTNSLPSPYKDELRGIARTAEVPLEHITIYNIFYELFALCTSIVVETPEGDILHGRNLDNGAFLGWNGTSNTWRVTEELKSLTVRVKWSRGGKPLFESITFVGYVGVLTAVKKDVLSFSLNKRMSWDNGIVGLFEWLALNDRNQHWVSLLAREVLEVAHSYEEAVERLSEARLIAPVYYIIAGPAPKQAAVITRYRDDVQLEEMPSWFLVQTNYDHWKRPPFFDDRRTPAMKCLRTIGPKGISDESLFNVLYTKPVRNKSTVYTALMSPTNGTISAWTVDCPDPCYPWADSHNSQG